MNDETPSESPPPELDAPAKDVPRTNLGRVWTSAEILGGEREVIIMHAGQAYRLRHTRQGKLILFK